MGTRARTEQPCGLDPSTEPAVTVLRLAEDMLYIQGRRTRPDPYLSDGHNNDPLTLT